MIRKIIKINPELCNGCGACAAACHEGAIQMIGGKAQLTREDYCDGLGDCLPACPTGAITFEEREAPAYDEEAVRKAAAAKAQTPASEPVAASGTDTGHFVKNPSQLRQWPVQIKLMPLTAPYYQKGELLIAADCTAYAYASFHKDFIQGRITLVGCPKLDQVNYAGKLTAIFQQNSIRSITVVRMEVPCCGGLEYAVRQAITDSQKGISLTVVTLSTQGEVLSTVTDPAF